MLKSIISDTPLKSPTLKATSDRITAFAGWKWWPLVLFILGLLRYVILLQAYPPAAETDAELYFLYANRFSGYDEIAFADHYVYPLYPMLMKLSMTVFGSLMGLIGLQVLMLSALAPIYYWGLRRISPIIAFVVAWIVLGDLHLAISANFFGTEATYTFLLGLSISLFLWRLETSGDRRFYPADLLPGALVVPLLLTRTVGRYLFLPFVVVIAIKTRSVTRTLTVLAGYALTYVAYALISINATGIVVGASATDYYLYFRVMYGNPNITVSAENGANSARWLTTFDECTTEIFHHTYCLYQETGNWEDALTIVRGAAFETVQANLPEFISMTWDQLRLFLRHEGIIYHQSPQQPNEAQCMNPPAERAANVTPELVDTFISRLSAHLLIYPDDERLPYVEDLQRRIEAFWSEICPPRVAYNAAYRDALTPLMIRYRSLGRPNPEIWYAAVLLLALLIPFARKRYLPVVLLFGAVLVNHALASAVMVDVRARFVMVVNPIRAGLLVTLIVIIGYLIIRAVDAWQQRRQSPQ